MSEGIDVSNNNAGAFDDAAAFCWIKSTEGASYLDTYYDHYVGLCVQHQIPWGAYHFAHPDVHSAIAEANYFLQRSVGQYPMLDVESRGNTDPLSIMGPSALATWISTFLDVVHNATGRPTIVYLNRSYLSALAPYARLWPVCLATLDGSKLTSWAGHPISVVQHSIQGGIDRDTDLVGYFTPNPPQPQGDDMAILIVRGDNSASWWATDYVTKRYIDTVDEAQSLVDDINFVGGKAVPINVKEVGPIVRPQHFIDAIPVVGQSADAPVVKLSGTWTTA